MRFCALVVLLGAMVTLAEASCYLKELKIGATHCQDNVDGTWHPIDSTWINSRCFRCTCGRCCSVTSYPINFPDDCVAELDVKACKYIVHKKSDPSVLCAAAAYVGK